MATANKAIGETPESGRDETVTQGQDYSAPKLIVVGTVQELTLAAGGAGAIDGIARTGGGG